MRVPLLLPDLGVGTEPVRVSGWLVDRDELILKGDRVAEVLIAGVTFDVEAIHSGRLVEIAKPTDSLIAPGEPLGWLNSLDDDSNQLAEPSH